MVVRKASNLCEDLIDDKEEGLGDHMDLLTQGVKVTLPRKKKKTSANRKLRRSARINKLNQKSR